jgi:hypothetical protein
MKAIETRYKGYRFRSRLEARWAVFFDAMGINWEYEVEGFHLPNKTTYLPDFYLSDFDSWVEIKPKNAERKEVFVQLSMMIESGAAKNHKAWGFFGDPLDHHWMDVFFTKEDLIFNGKVLQKAGWNEEWGNMTAFCALDCGDDGLVPAAGFSLTEFQNLLKSDFFPSYAKPQDLIDNYKEKVLARSARFEHGERG